MKFVVVITHTDLVVEASWSMWLRKELYGDTHWHRVPVVTQASVFSSIEEAEAAILDFMAEQEEWLQNYFPMGIRTKFSVAWYKPPGLIRRALCWVRGV